jgi:hypothetical protein
LGRDPQSFFNLSRFLKALGTEPKAELVGAIRDLLLAYPEGLGVLGVSEFSADDDEEDYEE